MPVMLAAIAADPGTALDGVTVRVTGPGIPPELLFNLGVPNSAWAALQSFDIPAGPARVFVAKAYAGVIQTHESDPTTADVTRTGVEVDLNLRTRLAGRWIESSQAAGRCWQQ